MPPNLKPPADALPPNVSGTLCWYTSLLIPSRTVQVSGQVLLTLFFSFAIFEHTLFEVEVDSL
jgi:hypothetical protein